MGELEKEEWKYRQYNTCIWNIKITNFAPTESDLVGKGGEVDLERVEEEGEYEQNTTHCVKFWEN